MTCCGPAGIHIFGCFTPERPRFSCIVGRQISPGQTEWHDVEPVVSYAVGQGARQIVLFVWSLGASIALQLAASSECRDLIHRLVLNAPVIDWSSTLVANARSSMLPGWVARLGLQILGSSGMRWITGLDAPLNLHTLDFFGPGGRTQCSHSCHPQ